MSLIYKEYLDEEQAAEFMCLEKSKFNEIKKSLGVKVYRLRGVRKNVYKARELQSIMETGLEWQQYIDGGVTGISNGVMEASVALASLSNSGSRRPKRPKTTDSQRNSS